MFYINDMGGKSNDMQQLQHIKNKFLQKCIHFVIVLKPPKICLGTIPYSLPAVTKTSPFAPIVYLRNFASAGR